MTAEQQLERSVLEGKERDELSAIAQAMSLKTTSRTKKADIIDQILDAYTFLAKEESIFCEAASSASVAGLLKQGVPEGSTVVCVLTGHGLKDPDLAIKSISVPTVIDLDLETVLAEIAP